MNPALIFTDYLLWHYGRAFREMLVTQKNLLWFTVHFFSIPLLLRTLFSPWKRIKEGYRRRGLEDMMATLVVNFMSRIVGAIVRLCIILVGLTALVALALALFVFFVFWLIAPAATVFSVIFGFVLLL